MKNLFIAGGVIALVLVVAVLLTLSNLGPLVKKTVNTLGPEITKTAVEVKDVSVSIFSGEAKIKEFLLGNPKGFTSDQAMKVGSVYVDIDQDSITSNPIVIDKIEIIAPEITYEQKSNSDNFKQILENVQQSAKTQKKAKPKEGSDGDKQDKKIVINNVIIQGGKVNLAMAELGGKEITAALPDLHLKDIGKEKQGASPAEAFEKIFSSLYGSITADSVTQIFNDGLKQFGNLTELGAEGLQSGAEAGKKAVDTASDTIESATEELKGLFKKD